MRFVGLGMLLLLATLAVGGCGGKESTPGEEAPSDMPFKGKTVTFIVPFSPGGGYDTYARLMQPYIAKYTGATVVVQNVTGGGGIIGSNKVYNSPPDGLTIGLLGGTAMVFNQTAGAEGVTYDVTRFTCIGRVTADPETLLVSTKRPFKSISDLIRAGNLKVAFTGVGDEDFNTWAVLARIFGISNYKAVTGWEGTSQWLSAIAAGEVDAGPISVSSGLPAVQNGYGRFILQIAQQRDPRLPDVPTLLEQVPANDANRSLAEALTACWEADRIIVCPPGLDAATVKYWREIYEKVSKDGEFLQKCEQSGRPFNYMAGEDVERTIQKAMSRALEIKPILEEAVKKAE